MTAFNTGYNKTELLDQELTTAKLSEVSGGCGDTTNTVVDPGFNGLPGIAEIMFEAASEYVYQELPYGLWSAFIFNFLLNAGIFFWVELLVNH